AQEKGQPPKLTPEQQAQMDIYMKAAAPGPEHQMLASSAGQYDLTIKSWEEAGKPPTEDKGTATRAMMLDGRVLAEDVHSTMGGMPFEGHGMTGFDNVSRKYWGTWMDNMGTGVMVLDGTCDMKKSCTFTGSFNDPVKKAPVKSRMTTRWTN